MKVKKVIAITTGLLTLLLAGFSFTLSFNALSELATEHGVSIPPLFPFVVEFAVIIFSLNALYRSLNGQSVKVQWVLIIGSSLLAGLFNVAHAEADLISRSMAAVPSLFLLLSFESFLSLVKSEVKVKRVKVKKQSKRAANEPGRPQFEPGDLDALSQANGVRTQSANERRQQVFELSQQRLKHGELAGGQCVNHQA